MLSQRLKIIRLIKNTPLKILKKEEKTEEKLTKMYGRLKETTKSFMTA